MTYLPSCFATVPIDPASWRVTDIHPQQLHTQRYELNEAFSLAHDEGSQPHDGIVWGGQKLKLGVPIEVEGYKYRLKGSVLDVRMVEPKQAAVPGATP